LDLLGDGEGPLAQRIWSPLHLALEESFIEHGGLIGFSHEYIRRAVEERYLEGETEKKTVCKGLADYCQKIPGFPRRKVDELPWQLQRIEDWDGLYAVLSDPAFFMAQWDINQFDLYAYWTSLEENSNFNRDQAYRGVLENPLLPGYRVFLFWLSLFLMNSGYLETAMNLLKEQEKIGRFSGNASYIQNAIGNQALILKTWGKLDKAMSLFKEQEDTYRKLGDRHGLQLALGNQATVLYTWGSLDEAMQMLKEKEHICREFGG
jgi:tetratricopeptide (TPR) repeat protein